MHFPIKNLFCSSIKGRVCVCALQADFGIQRARERGVRRGEAASGAEAARLLLGRGRRGNQLLRGEAAAWPSPVATRRQAERRPLPPCGYSDLELMAPELLRGDALSWVLIDRLVTFY